MINFDATVQEGCIPAGIRPELEAAITKICGDVIGEEAGPVSFRWAEVAAGNGVRGGEPSRTTMLAGVIPDGCDETTRTNLLMELGAAWYRIAGVTEHELVASARDRGSRSS